MGNRQACLLVIVASSLMLFSSGCEGEGVGGSFCAESADCLDPSAPNCVQGMCVPGRPQPDGAVTGIDPDAGVTDSGALADAGGHDARANQEDAGRADLAPKPDLPPPPPCGMGKKPTSFTWTSPKATYICQRFGNKIAYQSCGFHTGLDVCGKTGDPMVAMASGKIVHVGPMWLSGAKVGRGPYAVIIQHSPGFFSTYSHNNKAVVKVGDCVKKGQRIADMGNLGYSYGPHLHLEVLEGTKFTGDWKKPFTNACASYKDPLKYAPKP